MKHLLRNNRKNVVALLFAVFSWWWPHTPGHTAPASFFYFCPDSPQNNFTRLKEAMDALLTEGGFSYSFQAFAHFKDFERQVRDDPPGFLLLPEWYLRQKDNAGRFKPILVPLRQGVSTYRKALLVSVDSDLTLAKLADATIAMTPVGQEGMTMLNEVIFKTHGLNGDKLKFIYTAKDYDALFALALRQVQAALVAVDNMEYVERINPKIVSAVKILAVSEPIPRPLICYDKNAVPAADVEKLKTFLLAGKQNEKTAKIMEMLQIDAWQVYSY
ncbi:MAG: PhnD/SsuA/transferrin family substrate-binding protein [Deltaproteobacteria bacterium]|nr:PhnD/SsuA/transferrin family substrate-binding protein [Deltaproteobacteria bacterium]